MSSHTEPLLSVSSDILLPRLMKVGKLHCCVDSISCAWGVLNPREGLAKTVLFVSPFLMIVLNLSGGVWRLFVAESGLVRVANSFGTRCDLGRGIINKAIATASLSFCFMFEAYSKPLLIFRIQRLVS